MGHGDKNHESEDKRMSEQNSNATLKGCRVLDLASLIVGPYCASLLGDLGADVIKIEHPQEGDLLRPVGFESSLFLAINRNKQGMTLALDKPEGRGILDRIIAQSDVVIENFRPDIKKKLHLTYDDLCRVKEDVIHVSVTGFGESGPYSMKPGTDYVFQGLSGILTVSGRPDEGPVHVGVPVADMTTALYASFGAVSALLHRQKTGKGQQVSVNLLDAAMCLQTTRITEFLMAGQAPPLCGNDSPLAYPAGIFKTQDGYITISVFNDKFWRRLCTATGLEKLMGDARFQTPENRLNHRDALKRFLVRRFSTKTTAEWLSALEPLDVPCSAVHDYASVFQDPQVTYNGLVKTLPYARNKIAKTLGNPVRFSRSPALERCGAPLHGEDSVSILRDMGFSGQAIEQLSNRGII